MVNEHRAPRHLQPWMSLRGPYLQAPWTQGPLPQWCSSVMIASRGHEKFGVRRDALSRTNKQTDGPAGWLVYVKDIVAFSCV
jgi:hypothetical protein